MENFEKSTFSKISRQTQKYFKRKPKIDDFALKPPKAKQTQAEKKFHWKENKTSKPVSETAHTQKKNLLFPDGGQNNLSTEGKHIT